MIYSLTWLSAALRSAGLKVAEVDGWESRGNGDMGRIAGIICHHTAGPKAGNMPSLTTLIRGRSDLPGPLSQLGLGRDGTFYVIAAGRCNHGGIGAWKDVSGNVRFIGIEAENTGMADDSPWPAVQVDAYKRGVAAILRHIGKAAEDCVGHKEYALPKGRKDDPNFDMTAFRQDVAAILSGAVPPPALIPSTTPSSEPGKPDLPTLRRGDAGVNVSHLQELIGCEVDGYFGAKTEAAARNAQRDHGLVPDGIVGPKTWRVLLLAKII